MSYSGASFENGNGARSICPRNIQRHTRCKLIVSTRRDGLGRVQAGGDFLLDTREPGICRALALDILGIRRRRSRLVSLLDDGVGGILE
jgi:hypothetical protein